MKLFVLFLYGLMLSGFNIDAQDDATWKLTGNYTQSDIKSWDIDPLGNLIVSAHGILYKIDTDFTVLFTQSKNSLGDITKIDSRHSLKTLLFSEDQQILKFIDNTLTFQQGEIDLASLDVGFASLVCYSDQSEKFWVYDEQNSRLLRFKGFSSAVKSIEVSNLSSITGQHFPASIEENQNQLFLFYKENGVFIFDYYGSLIQKIDDTLALKVHPTEDYIYILRDKTMVKMDRKTGERQSIALPIDGIVDFRIFENEVYFKVESGIKKFSLLDKTITK